MAGDRDPPVEEDQVVGGQPRRYRIERGGQARAIRRHRGGGRGPLARCSRWRQLAVIGEQDEVTAGEIAVGRVPAPPRPPRPASMASTASRSVSRGTNLANCRPYTWRSPGRQYGRCGHSGGPPRTIRGAKRAQVADGAQPQPAVAVAPGHHEAVLVPRRGGLQDLHMPPGPGPGRAHAAPPPGRTWPRRPLAPGWSARTPGTPGTTSTRPSARAGCTNSRGPTSSCRRAGIPACINARA